MRHALAAAIVLVSSTALANPKGIEKTVRTSLAELARLSDNDALKVRSDAVVINTLGLRIELDQEDGCATGAVSNSMYGCVQGSFSHKPGAIAVGAEGGVGWFQAPFAVIHEGEDPETNETSVSKRAARMGGIVVGSGNNWAIVAAMYVYPVSDKELFKAASPIKGVTAPKLTGDKKLAGVVAGWFTTGLAPKAATKGTLIASGTSVAELKTGSAATKLVASWDKLEMFATEIDAKVLADGKVGWVFATVKLPRKNKKDAVEMKLAAVLLPDGAGSWRWVSLQYQYPNPGG